MRDVCCCVQVQQLVDGADAIGAVLVYRHQGFLPNKRQLRMGGLATLEMAQTLRHLVTAPTHLLPTGPGPACSQQILPRDFSAVLAMHHQTVD